MEFFIIIMWLVLAGAAAAYASNKGRSGAGIFFLALLLSPLVGFLVALAMEPNQQAVAEKKGMKKCPECAQFVQADARTCPFCKKTLSTQAAFSTGEFSPDALSKKCPACAETIKLEALVCRFCGHKFQPEQVQAGVQQAKSEFDAKMGTEAKDKISRNLCPNCDAYNAWSVDRQKNLRKCEVCGQEYPLAV
jgi:RNA polymerase subunit RPABC4/transcription elongation factor Spt4